MGVVRNHLMASIAQDWNADRPVKAGRDRIDIDVGSDGIAVQ